MIVDHTHDGCPSSFAFVTRKASAGSECFTTYTLGQPTDKETETRPAHSDDVFLVAKSLGKLVVLNM